MKNGTKKNGSLDLAPLAAKVRAMSAHEFDEMTAQGHVEWFNDHLESLQEQIEIALVAVALSDPDSATPSDEGAPARLLAALQEAHGLTRILRDQDDGLTTLVDAVRKSEAGRLRSRITEVQAAE